MMVARMAATLTAMMNSLPTFLLASGAGLGACDNNTGDYNFLLIYYNFLPQYNPIML